MDRRNTQLDRRNVQNCTAYITMLFWLHLQGQKIMRTLKNILDLPEAAFLRLTEQKEIFTGSWLI